MKRLLIICCILAAMFSYTLARTTYTNPILAGFYPDPSICRVGSDYYLVNSSFSFFPGLPLFHSQDLVHWEQIGNALDRPEQIDLSGIRISGGIYAPTLRYHKGLFYIVCTVVDGIGNFVITASSPEGPWSIPVSLPHVQGMDPDLFFDADGKAYVSSCAPANPVLYNGHRAIMMHEFYPESLTTSAEAQLLVDGGANPDEQPVWCEGPHLFRKGDFYYLICAEGGTSSEHSEVVFRSHSLDEPFVSYAHNPILTQRHLDPKRTNAVTNTGHADFVELPSGEWWCVFLGCRPYSTDNHFNTGRETFLLPVRWKEEWPIILNENEKVPLKCTVPKLPQAINTDFPLNGRFEYVEHFDKEELPAYMLHIRTPFTPFYQCDSALHLQLQPASLDEVACPSFVGRRQQHTSFGMTVSLDFCTQKDNELAGIVAFQNETHYYLFARNSQGLVLKRGADEGAEVIKEIILPDTSSIYFLRMVGNSTTYTFSYSRDNENWVDVTALDVSYLSTTEAGGFVGTIIGMYASSNGKASDNIAHFDWMKYEGF